MLMITVISLLMKKKSLSAKWIMETNNCILLSLERGNVYDLGGNVYDFSLDFNNIDKSDILNICKYLMVKNYLK